MATVPSRIKILQNIAQCGKASARFAVFNLSYNTVFLRKDVTRSESCINIHLWGRVGVPVFFAIKGVI